ncbi:helix-turn-helix domain-containing protein [Chryseobacterium sp. IT-36CA2]|uniref:helix-turn-helix domain-containing protein n=1 Tax=Chryseobacterium sp. IT-36CA2 TaxID=3026460 RepID=UPI0039E028A6
MKKSTINYQQIFMDILDAKYPEKKAACLPLLQKENLSEIDIITLNQKIFGKADKKIENLNQKHRSYGKSAILKILDFQKKNNMNNLELASYFNLSRNTITKWKKIFCVTN